jgi:scyllo-inositol 2-dehydrogenase (NADP+)
MDKVKVGLVGIGRAGWGMHCPELDAWKDEFEIVAGCDILEERRAKMQQRYNCRIYGKIEDLLSDSEVELVDIATRSCDHFKHALMSIKAGKDVLVEKPMAMTYQEALILKETSENIKKGKLFVRHNRRFDADFIQVKEIIESGILGDVFSIKLRRNSYNRRDDWQTIKEYGGGQLLNWGPHIIDHSLRFLDCPVKELFGNLKHISAAGDAEDHIKIVMVGINGRTVDMEISGGSVVDSATYQVYGTKGGMTLKDDIIYMKYLDPENELMQRVANPETPVEGFSGSKDNLKWLEKTMPVMSGDNSIIWHEIYKSIRCGSVYPINIDEAVEVMKIISEVKKGTEFEK